MYRGNTVAVVVPAYNEGGHVRSVIDTLPTLVDRAYVIDDGSTDGTWDEIRTAVSAAPPGRTFDVASDTGPGRTDGGSHLADPDAHSVGIDPDSGRTDGGKLSEGTHPLPEELPVHIPESEADPVIVAVRHGENRGRGAAVKTGYRLAREDEMEVVAVMDGDGQMDPERLHQVVHPVATGQADYAKGNRLSSRSHWRGMSGWRLFGNVLLTVLTCVSTGYWGLRDPQNGYTAISRSTLASLSLSALYDDYGFLNDLLAALSLSNARVMDVPLPAVYGDEDSGIRYAQFVPAVASLLLANFFRRLYVDGTRRRRVWLPAAYGAAGAAWLGTCIAALVALIPAGGALPLGPPGGTPALALAGAAGLTTALAVELDRRSSALVALRESKAVDPG